MAEWKISRWTSGARWQSADQAVITGSLAVTGKLPSKDGGLACTASHWLDLIVIPEVGDSRGRAINVTKEFCFSPP